MPYTTVQNPQPIAGRFMFVDYGVAGEPWHERWVFEVLENRHAVVVTPDHEVYVEVMQVGKRCFRNMRMCAAGGLCQVILARRRASPSTASMKPTGSAQKL